MQSSAGSLLSDNESIMPTQTLPASREGIQFTVHSSQFTISLGEGYNRAKIILFILIFFNISISIFIY